MKPHLGVLVDSEIGPSGIVREGTADQFHTKNVKTDKFSQA